VKLPRDISGDELAKRLARFGYRITRQTGSHLRLTSLVMDTEHHLTIPNHDFIKVGPFAAILGETAHYLQMDREQLLEELFGD
jgi:predicted RNA binding protein YcfA (HicA-like mRNA interferase family)